MREFRDADLTGSRFERTNMSGSTLDHVRLNDSSFRQVHLNRVDGRGIALYDTKLRGAEVVNTSIDGEIQGLLINGVDVAPLVEAELNRRDPERAQMRPTDVAGYRAAWVILERRWGDTVERARSFAPGQLHRSVDGEWSFIQTLRHLAFAIDAWIARQFLGQTSPWDPLDLPWDEAPGWDGIPWDREAKPSLEEAEKLFWSRMTLVREQLATLTDEQLQRSVSRDEPGWPTEKDMPVALCFETVVNEAYEHNRYAERDLDKLVEAPTPKEN